MSLSRERVAPVVDSRPKPTIESKSEFPDYLTEYTTIKSIEQRRRYKSDFNADYAEYRDLHNVVERVSRRFAQLEERLKQEDESSLGYKVSSIHLKNQFNNARIYHSFNTTNYNRSVQVT